MLTFTLMIRIAFKYIVYKLTARHRFGHGIHSPFMFGFVRNVLRNDAGIIVPENIKSWHDQLKRDKKLLQLDFTGLKSKMNSSDVRAVGEMAKHSSIRKKYGELLYRVSAYIKPEQIIELGTGLGISTTYLASGFPVAIVKTIEGSKNKSEFAEAELNKLGIKNVQYIRGRFDELLTKLKIVHGSGLIFIDGNHNYESTIRYFKHFRDQAGEETIIIFDDINWSEEMSRAWKEIVNDRKVMFSIDLFFFGIVFFRKGSHKQHYIINF